MELMHESLDKLIFDTKREFDLPQRLTVLRDVVTGLAMLHDVGVLHRDLKAANVLLDESCTIAKLTDFGSARLKRFVTTTTKVAPVQTLAALHARAPELVSRLLIVCIVL
jgi:serine/threonine protein kinase